MNKSSNAMYREARRHGEEFKFTPKNVIRLLGLSRRAEFRAVLLERKRSREWGQTGSSWQEGYENLDRHGLLPLCGGSRTISFWWPSTSIHTDTDRTHGLHVCTYDWIPDHSRVGEETLFCQRRGDQYYSIIWFMFSVRFLLKNYKKTL